MSPAALIFFIVVAIAMLSLPKKWAPISLIVGTAYMTVGSGIVIGGANLPIFRLLIFVGLIRVFFKGEWNDLKFTVIDRLMLFWAGWILFASFFHDFQDGSGPVYAIGVIINILGSYFLVRVWARDSESIRAIVTFAAIALAPLALEMLSEHLTRKNMFHIFGRVSESSAIRNGRLRAQGPFPHPILAGTVGATCFPLMLIIWRENKKKALIGMVACLSMVIACNSSGPIMSLMASFGALIIWKWRHLTGMLRAAAVMMYIALELYMERPAYFVISKIDLTGSSTGYHRARLIESAFQKLNEWWLFGTDFTRHWMPTGVSFSPNHTDITNYYLAFGVNAGLLGLLTFVIILLTSFKKLGEAMRLRGDDHAWLYWCLGAGLFSHAVTSISVSYYGQSMFFLWMNVALVGSVIEESNRLEVEEYADDELSDEQFAFENTSAVR